MPVCQKCTWYPNFCAYFYRLRDHKTAEFWLLADADFDYTE
ncbi:hypothetical protein [Mycolicibacterium aromaticivorans]|nr:hypothetical protein [Mycolicibacterium aromaticivorans]